MAKATPPPRIQCDKCGKRDVPAIMRVLVEGGKAWTFCLACDPEMNSATQ